MTDEFGGSHLLSHCRDRACTQKQGAEHVRATSAK